MPTKDQMLKVISDLPDDASVDDAVERLYLLEKIERGIAQADAGQIVSHEEALHRLSRWLKEGGPNKHSTISTLPVTTLRVTHRERQTSSPLA